jgi:hypothetical protein
MSDDIQGAQERDTQFQARSKQLKTPIEKLRRKGWSRVRGRVWHYHDTAFKVRLQNTAAGWCYQVYRWFKGDQLMAEGPPSPSAQAAVIDGMVWVENQTANPE